MKFQCVNQIDDDGPVCAANFLEWFVGQYRKKDVRVVLLRGDLGSGKTTFVQSLASELGIRDVVDSPTFTLVQEYPIPQQHPSFSWKRLVHIDLYRLSSNEEFQEIGLLEYCRDEASLVIVEWGEKAIDFCQHYSVPFLLLFFDVQDGKYMIQQ